MYGRCVGHITFNGNATDAAVDYIATETTVGIEVVIESTQMITGFNFNAVIVVLFDKIGENPQLSVSCSTFSNSF